MDSRFLRAFTEPRRRRFLGRDLFPWCLKYRMRLMAFHSPFVAEDGQPREIGFGDLLLAAHVCSETPLGTYGLKDALCRFFLRDEVALASAVVSFREYMGESMLPKFWAKAAGGRTSESVPNLPWPLAIVATLIRNGVEEKRAWEMPEAQAVWLHATFAIQGGADVSILTTDEEEFLDSLASESEVKEPDGPETGS